MKLGCFRLVFTAAIFAAAVLAQTSNQQSFQVPHGLPPIPFPADNPYSAAKANLGKALFFDGRLSSNGKVSCASCHDPQNGFSGTTPFSPGVNGKLTGRHSPTLINRAWGKTEFWDGRAPTIEAQVIIPITNPDEMGMTADRVVQLIRGISGYAPLFRGAFGGNQVDFDRIAKALATFVRTIVSGNSLLDRFEAGEKEALTKEQKRGMTFFNGKGECTECHSGPNFTNEKFANLGIGFDKPAPDMGLGAVTGKRGDTGKFKVPTLRDVARRSPYMHDGRFGTLQDVLQFYAKGGFPNPHLDERILSFYMDRQIESDLITFLQALNGEGWQSIKSPDKLPH
jgi:cytochrome c peroxidase